MKQSSKDEVLRAIEQAKVQDTLILQKINATHRMAFTSKYPTLIEHILRLLVERLQSGLDKRDNVDLNDVTTWKLSPTQLLELSTSVYYLHQVRNDLKHVGNRNINE
jgi:hypothetical protein